MTLCPRGYLFKLIKKILRPSLPDFKDFLFIDVQPPHLLNFLLQ